MVVLVGFVDLALSWVVETSGILESNPSSDAFREARMVPVGKLLGVQYNRDRSLSEETHPGIYDSCRTPSPRLESRSVTKLVEGVNVVSCLLVLVQ
jgi:hypothetical protein